jgi:release factor glutamine methyltransferase
MTLKEAVELATTTLNSVSDNAKLDAQLLICHVCNIEQTKFIAHPELVLSDHQIELFNSAVNRRTQGEPLAYITGTKEFWSLEFIVNKDVLIPRPETELLVEFTLKAISEIDTPRILDLGTGSGAIAISLAKQRNDCLITATDISLQALNVAKNNAKRHGTKITFAQSNWYENLIKEKFDVIVCNPPYIAIDDVNLEKYVCQYEPNSALISKNDGLQDLELVIAGAVKYLSSAGNLAVEHGFKQAEKVQSLFNQHGFDLVQTHKDLAEQERMSTGQNPKMA